MAFKVYSTYVLTLLSKLLLIFLLEKKIYLKYFKHVNKSPNLKIVSCSF